MCQNVDADKYRYARSSDLDQLVQKSGENHIGNKKLENNRKDGKCNKKILGSIGLLHVCFLWSYSEFYDKNHEKNTSTF